MIDVSYNGAYAQIPVQMRVNALPGQYWTKGMIRNQANDDFLNQNFANPYNIKNLSGLQQSDPTLYRYMSGQAFFTGANMARNRLLRAYPQYGNLRIPGGLDGDSRNGYNTYHDMQLLVERRFTKGFQTTFMYTYATSQVADWMANEYDLKSHRAPEQQRPAPPHCVDGRL